MSQDVNLPESHIIKLSCFVFHLDHRIPLYCLQPSGSHVYIYIFLTAFIVVLIFMSS